MAHQIPQRKHFIRRYGRNIIHHELNFKATCGLKCNNAVSIANKPVAINALVKEIEEASGDNKTGWPGYPAGGEL